MAVTQLSAYLYMGFSTDTFPVADVFIGSVLFTLDAHNKWIFDGENWQENDVQARPYNHIQVHLGNMWCITALVEGVSNNATFDLSFVGQEGVEFDALWELSAAGQGHLTVHEGIVLEPGTGDPACIRNGHRPSTDVDPPVSLVNPTVNDLGATIYEHYVPGGSGGTAPGALGARSLEFVLTKDVTYLFRWTNKAGQAKDASWLLTNFR